MFTATTQLISFAGKSRIAAGDPADVAVKTKAYGDSHPAAQLLIFDAGSGRLVELDLRGSSDDVRRRVKTQTDGSSQAQPAGNDPAKPARGRPRLGVSAREVTLLPRHWDWLARQPGSASVSLRKLVEKAMRENCEIDQRRERIESTYRFMLAMAGDEGGFEEAARALFANDMEKFARLVAAWPEDIRRHCLVMTRDGRG